MMLAGTRAAYAPESLTIRPHTRISLAEALSAKWVEFWYQPKIDLRVKQIAGVEVFARVRHPSLGVMSPGEFMRDADSSSLAKLAELAIVAALRTSMHLSRFGVNVRLAVNVSLNEVINLSIPDLVRKYIPQSSRWAGMMLDLPESDVMPEIQTVVELSNRLRSHNIHFALDGFGRCLFLRDQCADMPKPDELRLILERLSSLRPIRLAEVKIDPRFVKGCGKSSRHRGICKVMVELSRVIGSTPVAIGIENSSDLFLLQKLGCGLGQGYLFGEPLSFQQFLAVLQGRVGRSVSPQTDELGAV